MSTAWDLRPYALVVAVAALVSACSSQGEEAADPARLEDPATRAVVVETVGCGDATDARGSGIAIAPDLVLTAAHVVLAAETVSVGGIGDPDAPQAPTPAEVIAFDPIRDLALLQVASPVVEQLGSPVFTTLDTGDRATLIGGATSGDVAVEVAARVRITATEVRGDRPSERSGYRVEAETAIGDSGAGLYDQTGRLAGMLFAVSTDDPSRSWVLAAAELDAFLDDESSTGSFACNPGRSRIERSR